MSLKVLCVSVLLLAVCLYFESFADASLSVHPGGRHPGKSRLCCVDVTTVNVSSNVTGNTYREQKAKKPCVHAIILNTNNGQVCADPKAKWVEHLIANMTKE